MTFTSPNFPLVKNSSCFLILHFFINFRVKRRLVYVCRLRTLNKLSFTGVKVSGVKVLSTYWSFSCMCYRWVLRCLIRWEFWLNFFPHSWHVKGFSPVWVLWCVWRCEFWLKLFPHHEHLYGFTPWCVVKCLLRSDLHLNLLSHCSHLYGFSSVWILWCLIRSELTLKLFPHSWHLKGFSPARSFLWRSISFSSSCFQVESFFFFFTGKSRCHFPTLCTSPWFFVSLLFTRE